MAKTGFIPETDAKEHTLTIGEKYLLTIKEASMYFNIGIKKMRRLAEDNLGVFSVYSGNRYLIIRPKFEEYICKTSTI
ncbi:MAG: excisionase [Candidatus Ornithomonoglobus sp.]